MGAEVAGISLLRTARLGRYLSGYHAATFIMRLRLSCVMCATIIMWLRLSCTLQLSWLGCDTLIQSGSTNSEYRNRSIVLEQKHNKLLRPNF